jgi:3-phenylpropionate/cinnamic acid dioxygenase small subunit
MAPTEQDIINFILQEARLLDDGRFGEWLNMFAEDGIYWMPLEHGQTEQHLTTSLLYEDMFLLRTRVERLEGDRTFSQKPKSRCQHLLQAPSVERFDSAANIYETYTPFHYVEARREEQELFAGWARHTLAEDGGVLKIKLKRVDIVNCDAPHRNIQLFM